MGLAEDLQKLTVARLKKEVSATNIKGFSKMRKAELIQLMVKNADKFQHLVSAGEKKAEKKGPFPKAEKSKAPPRRPPPRQADFAFRKSGGKVEKVQVPKKKAEGDLSEEEFMKMFESSKSAPSKTVDRTGLKINDLGDTKWISYVKDGVDIKMALEKGVLDIYQTKGPEDKVEKYLQEALKKLLDQKVIKKTTKRIRR